MEHNHHNKESFWGAALSFMVSITKAFFTHIDWWAVLQSIICAILGFFIVRFLSKYFPKHEN